MSSTMSRPRPPVMMVVVSGRGALAMLWLDIVIPRFAVLWWCPEVHTRPDYPEKQKETSNGADDNAGNSASAESCATAATAVRVFDDSSDGGVCLALHEVWLRKG